MKREFKQWCSPIPPISTIWTITSHHKWTHWTQKRPRHMTLETQVLAWNMHKTVSDLKRLKESQPFYFDNWIFNGNTYIKQTIKTCTDSLPLKRLPEYPEKTTVQWFATGRWFSPGIPASSTNKTDRHDIAEILLKVVLNSINLTKTTNQKTYTLSRNWMTTWTWTV